MEILTIPQDKVEEFKRLEAAKYKPNWAYHVSVWLEQTWVLALLVVSVALLNYFVYKNSILMSVFNGILITAFIMFLLKGITKGPGVWSLSEYTGMSFAANPTKTAGAQGTFDWEIEVLRRDDRLRTLATVIWVIERVNGKQTRHGIAMWTTKQPEPKKARGAQTTPQPA